MLNRTYASIVIICYMFTWCLATSFDVAVVGSMDKIRCDGANAELLPRQAAALVDLARDEAESFQIVVIPQGQTLSEMDVQVRMAKPAQGLTLQWYRVGYVKTGNPGYAVSHVGLWPDILWPAAPFNVQPDEVQPLWVTVSTSPDTPAGVYRALATINCGDDSCIVPITIRVRSFVIPRPGTLATPFGVYRSFLEQWYYGKTGSLQQDDFLRWCRFLADYRLTAKNIGYEYVEREYETREGQKYLAAVDYSKTAKGLKQLSNQFFADYSYGLYRMPSGPTVKKAIENPERHPWCTPERIASDAEVYFREFRKLGFNDKAYIYGIDEVIGDDMFEFARKTYVLTKERIPSAKIMQTGNCKEPKLVGLVDIWCPKIGLSDDPFFQERLAEGDMLWEYVCGSPLKPYLNFLVDHDGIDCRMMFWHTKRINGTGFLYWTVISGCRDWEPKPWQDPSAAFPHSTLDFSKMLGFTDLWVHSNGDGQLVYPGANLEPIPSIRLEIIRDGIEDFEYFGILRNLLDDVKAIEKYNTAGTTDFIAQAEALTRVPDDICRSAKDFNSDPAALLQRRRQMADMIEQLQHILEVRDHETWTR